MSVTTLKKRVALLEQEVQSIDLQIKNLEELSP